ncbi:glycosyltransferase family 2 protein [Legionella sp. CNM-1927-20]|uniref:glycosyltransferase family 2 protein n=1 Tax=Legionella sp. CNM-1927-20 TaxID=3422221 RepID=UPI00403B2F6D
MIKRIIDTHLFHFIYICELLAFTNNKFYFNLLFRRQFLNKCKELSQGKNNFYSTLASLYLEGLHNIPFENIASFTKNLSNKDLKKVIKAYIQVNPEIGLKLLERINKNSKLAFIYRSQLFPTKEDEQKLKQLQEKKPALIFNLYNHLHFFHTPHCEQILNQYFISHNLLPIYKIDTNKPLYINNIASKSNINDDNKYGKVSIIMSAKDEEFLIEKSTESLIKQTYANIEIIFINDASTDRTKDIFISTCRKYYFNDFKIVNLKKNVGPFYCMNLGLEIAQGEFITFHGADDWAHPQRISFQLKEIIKYNAVASMSKLIRIKPTGELFSKHIYPLNRICVSSLLFKRKVISDLGYFYTDLLGSDSEYPERIRLFYGACSLIVSPLVLTIAAHRNDSRTTCNQFGTANFGINKRRLLDLEILMQRLYEQFKLKEPYYVGFNPNQYSI